MADRVTSPGSRSPGEIVVCADVGSTFTKAAAIGPGGQVLAISQHPTTSAADVLEGLDAAVAALGVGQVADSSIVACSSAGGGLRLAVVGHERVISAEAGRRVALSAGARVVWVSAGFLDAAGVDALASAAPDVLLVVGGTDGGDAEVLLHNCRALGRSALEGPIVLAGNSDATAQGAALLRGRGRVVLTTANVIPRIGALDPEPARRAIREVFITHVIGGKGLSPGPRFGHLVAGATPDAVLAGIEVVAGVRSQAPDALGDVMALDIGGATTDVYSVLTPDEGAPHDAVETLWHGRTVEGDLGMRWSAPDVVAAARAERLFGGGAGGAAGGGASGGGVGDGGGGGAGAPAGGGAPGVGAPGGGAPGVGVGGTADAFDALVAAAERRRDQVAFLPSDAQDVSDDLLLARLAAIVAARRHGRPGPQGSRDLTHVALLIGSGGVLRHSESAQALGVLDAVLTDVAGGWRLPRQARVILDRQYLLAPIGLLELSGRPATARALARTLLEQ